MHDYNYMDQMMVWGSLEGIIVIISVVFILSFIILILYLLSRSHRIEKKTMSLNRKVNKGYSRSQTLIREKTPNSLVKDIEDKKHVTGQFCPNCGAQLGEERAKFCPFCGSTF